MELFYHFKDGTNIKLIFESNNKCAAENGMLKAYGKTRDQISHSGGNELNFRPYQTFDGRNYH